MKLHTINSMSNNNNNNNSINNNNNNNNNFKNLIIDKNGLPDKSVIFEKRLAATIFCIVHFIVYCIIIFRKDTILDQAFKDKDYFYLIWTHCVFIFSIFTYFVVVNKKPGFVSLNNNNNNNNNINNNNSSNSFILDDSMGCIPQFNHNINNNINNNNTTNNNRKLKNSNSNDDLEPLLDITDSNTGTSGSSSSSSSNGTENNTEQENNNNNNEEINKKIDKIDKLKNSYFCKKCLVDIPLRTKHCLKCNRCVLKYDHHCVFIGGCVGLNNHANFITFLLAETLLLLLGLRIISTGFIYKDTIKDWIWENLLIIPPTLLMFGGLCMPFALFLFHSFLVITNQSSWEFNKYQRITYLKPFAKRGINPFDKGSWNNIKKFIKGTEHPSDWKLLSKYDVDQIKKKRENSFNIWNNKYYSCCG